MSGFTGLMFEEIYSYAGAATTTTPTAGAVITTATYPTIEIPAGHFTKLGKASSSVKLMLRGQMTTTATIPTWLWGVAWTQTVPGSFVVTNGVATAARTPGTAGTGAWWHLDCDITLRAIAPGSSTSTTIVMAGTVSSEGLLPSAFSTTITSEWSMPATNVSGASSAAIDVDQPIFLWPYITLGAATAGNTVTTQMAKLYGEN